MFPASQPPPSFSLHQPSLRYNRSSEPFHHRFVMTSLNRHFLTLTSGKGQNPIITILIVCPKGDSFLIRNILWLNRGSASRVYCFSESRWHNLSLLSPNSSYIVFLPQLLTERYIRLVYWLYFPKYLCRQPSQFSKKSITSEQNLRGATDCHGKAYEFWCSISKINVDIMSPATAWHSVHNKPNKL